MHISLKKTKSQENWGNDRKKSRYITCNNRCRYSFCYFKQIYLPHELKKLSIDFPRRFLQICIYSTSCNILLFRLSRLHLTHALSNKWEKD